MRLRRLSPGDTNTLTRVTRSSIAVTGPQAYDEQQVASWLGFATPDQVAPYLQEADGGFVVEVDGHPVGYATRRGNELHLLYVDPGHHRQGVARRLVTAVEEDAAAAGFDRLELDASLVALAAFRRLGFHERGRLVKDRDGVRIETVRMVKFLGAIDQRS